MSASSSTSPRSVELAADLELKVSSLDQAAIEAVRGWRQGYCAAGGTVHKPQLDELWATLSGPKG